LIRGTARRRRRSNAIENLGPVETKDVGMNQAEGSVAPPIGESSIEKSDQLRIDFDPNDARRTFEQYPVSRPVPGPISTTASSGPA
jgi:hypothetical protein